MVVLGLGTVAIAVNSLVHMPNWDINVYWMSWCIPGLAHGVGSWKPSRASNDFGGPDRRIHRS